MDVNDKLLILTFYKNSSGNSGLEGKTAAFCEEFSKRLTGDENLGQLYEIVVDHKDQNPASLRAKVVYVLEDIHKIPLYVSGTVAHLENSANEIREEQKRDGTKIFGLDSLRVVPLYMYDAQAEAKAVRSLLRS